MIVMVDQSLEYDSLEEWNRRRAAGGTVGDSEWIAALAWKKNEALGGAELILKYGENVPGGAGKQGDLEKSMPSLSFLCLGVVLVKPCDRRNGLKFGQ